MDYPKHIKKLIGQFAGEAYELELRMALGNLDKSFSEWREGRISSFDLEACIHKFHDGISRTLYNRYDMRNADLTLPYAIVAGILKREDLPQELLEAFADRISYYQTLKDDDNLREPGTCE